MKAVVTPCCITGFFMFGLTAVFFIRGQKRATLGLDFTNDITEEQIADTTFSGNHS
jgi:hypothetical protein